MDDDRQMCPRCDKPLRGGACPDCDVIGTILVSDLRTMIARGPVYIRLVTPTGVGTVQVIGCTRQSTSSTPSDDDDWLLEMEYCDGTGSHSALCEGLKVIERVPAPDVIYTGPPVLDSLEAVENFLAS